MSIHHSDRCVSRWDMKLATKMSFFCAFGPGSKMLSLNGIIGENVQITCMDLGVFEKGFFVNNKVKCWFVANKMLGHITCCVDASLCHVAGHGGHADDEKNRQTHHQNRSFLMGSQQFPSREYFLYRHAKVIFRSTGYDFPVINHQQTWTATAMKWPDDSSMSTLGCMIGSRPVECQVCSIGHEVTIVVWVACFHCMASVMLSWLHLKLRAASCVMNLLQVEWVNCISPKTPKWLQYQSGLQHHKGCRTSELAIIWRLSLLEL